jgi:hypothetical protein
MGCCNDQILSLYNWFGYVHLNVYKLMGVLIQIDLSVIFVGVYSKNSSIALTNTLNTISIFMIIYIPLLPIINYTHEINKKTHPSAHRLYGSCAHSIWRTHLQCRLSLYQLTKTTSHQHRLRQRNYSLYHELCLFLLQRNRSYLSISI